LLPPILPPLFVRPFQICAGFALGWFVRDRDARSEERR
jgi:hypothetical protein